MCPMLMCDMIQVERHAVATDRGDRYVDSVVGSRLVAAVCVSSNVNYITLL